MDLWQMHIRQHSLFGFKIELVGFQGGIIIALMMGYVVAKLDVFFNKKIPDVIKLLVAPLLTVFISTVLLFTVIGPVGRILSNGITDAMVWGTDNLGVFGCALFAGIQQLVVITGLRRGSAAHCKYGNELYQSTDVSCSNGTRWSCAWISGSKLEKFKSQGIVYSKFPLYVIWNQ